MKMRLGLAFIALATMTVAAEARYHRYHYYNGRWHDSGPRPYTRYFSWHRHRPSYAARPIVRKVEHVATISRLSRETPAEPDFTVPVDPSPIAKKAIRIEPDKVMEFTAVAPMPLPALYTPKKVSVADLPLDLNDGPVRPSNEVLGPTPPTIEEVVPATRSGTSYVAACFAWLMLGAMMVAVILGCVFGVPIINRKITARNEPFRVLS